MNKWISVLMPYIIAICVIGLGYIGQAEIKIIEVVIVGLLTGCWFLNLEKTEGTKIVNIFMGLSVCLFFGLVIANDLFLHIDLLSQFQLLFVYLGTNEIIGLYRVHKNKPYQGMTYKYSYKNRRKRYF